MPGNPKVQLGMQKIYRLRGPLHKGHAYIQYREHLELQCKYPSEFDISPDEICLLKRLVHSRVPAIKVYVCKMNNTCSTG